ncbi:hypothetical protein TNCV_3340881 [Trichonephila clavipes]|nr:hypothetical protein TNCV_3340881 [Trichonephila clavipes]
MPRITLHRLMRIWSYTIFKYLRFVCLLVFFIHETHVESVPQPGETGNLNEEAVDLARQKNFEVDSNDVEVRPNFHNQELTFDKVIEMY